VSTSGSELAMTVSKEGGETVLALAGDLDVYTATRLRERLVDLIGDTRLDLVVDLAELVFVDSTGLGTLVDGMKRVRQAGGSMALRSPTPAVQRVIDITGLGRVLPLTES
jgi:anti-sigma B factor antagonist